MPDPEGERLAAGMRVVLRRGLVGLVVAGVGLGLLTLAVQYYLGAVERDAKNSEARVKAEMLHIALKSYMADVGCFPVEGLPRQQETKLTPSQYQVMLLRLGDGKSRGINPVSADGTFLDPWGHEYVVSVHGDAVQIRSMGPDGCSGAPEEEADDVVLHIEK